MKFVSTALVGAIGAGVLLFDAPAAAGERVSGPGFDGVVMMDVGPGSWMPTRSEIAELENALPADTSTAWNERKAPSARRLSEYRRQYVGRTQAQRRVIHVTFLHNDTTSVRSGEWLQRLILVAGGGDMYLSADYDPEVKALLSFSANAQR